jgi:hypothetical protein
METLYILRGDDLEEIVRNSEDQYVFLDGTPVPEELKTGFHTTIFNRSFQPPFESLQKVKSEANS